MKHVLRTTAVFMALLAMLLIGADTCLAENKEIMMVIDLILVVMVSPLILTLLTIAFRPLLEKSEVTTLSVVIMIATVLDLAVFMTFYALTL